MAARIEAMEATNDVQRRMLDAAARRPRTRDELAERLRDGRFLDDAGRGLSAGRGVLRGVSGSGGRGACTAAGWIGGRRDAERLCGDAGAGSGVQRMKLGANPGRLSGDIARI